MSLEKLVASIPNPDKVNRKSKVTLHILAIIYGLIMGCMMFFSVLFLSKVLPNGGI